jgi:hypothetical protein
MKTLRQLCVAVVFTLALATSTFAGIIEIGSPAPPPPSQPAQTATVNGEMQIGLTGQEETGSGEVSATDSATETALNLLQSVLALF